MMRPLLLALMLVLTAPALADSSLPPAPAANRQLADPAKEAEAKDRLREAQAVAGRLIAKADPFTEKVLKGSQELYRARFAGFDQNSAEAACKLFKRNDIACMAMKN